MKISIISPNPHHLESLGALLRAQGYSVQLSEGGKSRMREVAERDDPQLMLVDGLCCDPAELEHVEYVTTHHPQTAVMLLCSTHTPEFLLQSMRAGVREVLPSPPPSSQLIAALQRLQARMAPTQRPRGKVLAFMSCKGGSGATFLATNLGWQLAENSSVLLVDLNLQFGDALSFMHDGRPAATIADVARDTSRLDASLLSASTVRLSPNYSVLAAPNDLAQAVEVTPEQVDAVLTQAVSQFDFVIVDLERSLDMRSVRVLDRAFRICLVMQAALPDVRHAGRLVDSFRSLGYPAERTELVVNRHDRNSDIGLDQIQRAVGNTRVRTVPNAWRDVNASINHGEPVSQGGRASALTRQLKEIAQELNPRAQEENRGFFERLRRRA